MTKENEPPSDITFKTHKADVTFDLHYPWVIFLVFSPIECFFFSLWKQPEMAAFPPSTDEYRCFMCAPWAACFLS